MSIKKTLLLEPDTPHTTEIEKRIGQHISPDIKIVAVETKNLYNLRRANTINGTIYPRDHRFIKKIIKWRPW